MPYAALKDARLVTRPSSGRSGFKIDESGRAATMAYGDINVTLTLQLGQRPDVDGWPSDTALTTLWITVDNPTDFIRALLHARAQARFTQPT